MIEKVDAQEAGPAMLVKPNVPNPGPEILRQIVVAVVKVKTITTGIMIVKVVVPDTATIGPGPGRRPPWTVTTIDPRGVVEETIPATVNTIPGGTATVAIVILIQEVTVLVVDGTTIVGHPAHIPEVVTTTTTTTTTTDATVAAVGTAVAAVATGMMGTGAVVVGLLLEVVQVQEPIHGGTVTVETTTTTMEEAAEIVVVEEITNERQEGGTIVTIPTTTMVTVTAAAAAAVVPVATQVNRIEVAVAATIIHQNRPKLLEREQKRKANMTNLPAKKADHDQKDRVVVDDWIVTTKTTEQTVN